MRHNAVALNHTKRSWVGVRPLPAIIVTKPIVNVAFSVAVCNTGIGHFHDDLRLLANAMMYLRKYQRQSP